MRQLHTSGAGFEVASPRDRARTAALARSEREAPARRSPPSRSAWLLICTLILTSAALAFAAPGAGAEEPEIKLSDTELRARLYTSEVVSQLTSLQARQANENGTLRLLETQLIDKVEELRPFDEASALEMGNLLASVHVPEAGETLGAAIQDLDAIVEQLGLREPPSKLTPLLQVVRVAAKSVGQQLLKTTQFARPGSFDPYAKDLFWWLGPPESPATDQVAVETAWDHAQHSTAFNGLLTGVIGTKLPPAVSTLQKLLDSASEPTKHLSEKLSLGTSFKEVEFAVKNSALDIQAQLAKGDPELLGKIAGKKSELELGNSLLARLKVAAKAEGAVGNIVAEMGTTLGQGLLSQFADPAALALALPSIISTIVNIASGTPSTEEVILEQLVQIQKMIQELGKHIEGQFAHVNQSIAALGLAIQEDSQLLTNANAHIGDISNGIAQLEEKLNQLQANQFEIAKAQREEALTTTLNTYIGYSERTPGHSPLPLPLFEQAAGTLFTYGTYSPSNAISELPRSSWPADPSEIFERLSSPASTSALDFNLQYLASYADAGEWGDGLTVSPGLPNPAVWANGASAFAQLLTENPQYVTEPLLREFGRLKEVGGVLAPELGKLAQHGSKREPTTEETGSSVLNHALENYLQDGASFLARLSGEEHYFLAQQSPGRESDPNCVSCTLARAPNPGVAADTGEANMNLWQDAEQTPSQSLTPFETTSSGSQPEENGARTPAQINACNHKVGEGSRMPVPAQNREFVEKLEDGETPGPVSVSGSTITRIKHLFPLELETLPNPMLDPLANVFANAWHLGIGHLTTCYQEHRFRYATGTKQYICNFLEAIQGCDELETSVFWYWTDNRTGKRTELLNLTIEEHTPAIALGCEGRDLLRRVQLMWQGKTKEENDCIHKVLEAQHFDAPFLYEAVPGAYEPSFALALSELPKGGKFTWADRSPYEVPGSHTSIYETHDFTSSEERNNWKLTETFAFYMVLQLHEQVEEQLRALRLATYRDVAPRELPALSAANENVHRAAAILNGGRTLLNDYIQLALPASATRDPTLSKLLFGPGHLLDNSPGSRDGGSFEIYEYLTKEIEHEEEEAAAKHQNPVVDPAQPGSVLQQRLSGRAHELLSQLQADIAASGGPATAGAAQIAQGDPLIGKTLAHLELAEFALLPTEAPHVGTQPVSTTVLEPAAASFTADASGGPEVQWEVSTDRGKTFTPDTKDPGNTSGTLTVEPTVASQSGNEYRANFKNSVGTVTSEPATLTVIPRVAPKVTKQPVATSATEEDPATFTAEASGSPAPTVQWEVSTDGGKTFNADTTDTGNTTTTLTVPSVAPSQNGYQYRARFDNVAGSVTSEAAPLTVRLRPAPAFTIDKAQEIKGSGAGFTTTPLSGQSGQTVLYRITVRNTGNVPLRLANFVDVSCANIAGGPGTAELAPHEATAWTCERVLGQTSTYVNEASVEAIPPLGDGFPLMHVSNQVVAYGPKPAPTVETNGATEVGQRTATVNATVNPRGGEVKTCKFEYGTSSLSSSWSCSKLPGSGTARVAVSSTLKGLAPNTTYRFRISATNGSGTGKGSEATLTTLAAAAPTAETAGASEVLQRSAIVNATVNPHGGEVTTCKFEYGTTSLSSSASCSALPAGGTATVKVSATLRFLSSGTTYHYRISASGPSGTGKGSEGTFTTIAAFAPTAETGSASEVLQRTATVGGTVNPNGGEVSTCRFEYGTTSFSSSASCTKLPGSGTTAVLVSAGLKGLAPGTTYRFRLSASSPSGTGKGSEGTFKTIAAFAPTAETGGASEVLQRTATVGGTVNPNGGEVTACKLEYGTTSLGSSTSCSALPGSGTAPVKVTANLKGLTPNTSYRFRISATSASGTGKGAEATLKTTAAQAPTVETLSATEVGEHTALLNATVDPNGSEVTGCKFEYGITTLGSSASCVKAPGLGTAPVAVSAPLKGLTPKTTYRFRVSATSLSGTSKGVELTFKT